MLRKELWLSEWKLSLPAGTIVTINGNKGDKSLIGFSSGTAWVRTDTLAHAI